MVFSINRFILNVYFCAVFAGLMAWAPTSVSAREVVAAEHYYSANRTNYSTPEEACEQISVGLYNFYYSGTNGNFDRFVWDAPTDTGWSSPRSGNCVDAQGDTFPLGRYCLYTYDDGSASVTASECEKFGTDFEQCTVSEARQGNPTYVASGVKLEKATDWVSPVDSRFENIQALSFG